MSDFTGFPAEGLALLQSLPRRDAAWFKANQKAYRATVLEPYKDRYSYPKDHPQREQKNMRNNQQC